MLRSIYRRNINQSRIHFFQNHKSFICTATGPILSPYQHRAHPHDHHHHRIAAFVQVLRDITLPEIDILADYFSIVKFKENVSPSQPWTRPWLSVGSAELRCLPPRNERTASAPWSRPPAHPDRCVTNGARCRPPARATAARVLQEYILTNRKNATCALLHISGMLIISEGGRVLDRVAHSGGVALWCGELALLTGAQLGH